MFTLIALAANASPGDAAQVGGLAVKIAEFFNFIIGRIPSWIAGFVLFILTFFAARIAKSAVESRIASQVDEEHQDVLIVAGRITYYGTLIFGITIALKIAGIDLTTILAAGAFSIGFALKDLIMNFLAGVFLLVNRQFAIGDFIQIGNTIGKVTEIQTRATILKTFNGLKVIVPNADIFRKEVISWTTNPLRRIKVPIYVSYDTDLRYATEIALETIKKHPKVLTKPQPSIIVKDYGNSSVDLVGRFWVGSRDGWYRIRSEVMHMLWDAFAEAGIVVPYNTLHLETEQDASSYYKAADEKSRKGKQRLGLGAEEPAAPAADAASANGGVGQLAAESVPAEPDAVYEEFREIDGQG